MRKNRNARRGGLLAGFAGFVLVIGLIAPAPSFGSPGQTYVQLSTEAPTAADLAASLVGEGVTVANASHIGASGALGSFEDLTGAVGFAEGVILSSGAIANYPGPNNSDSISVSNGQPGDADLTALSSQNTNDAAILSFEFTPDADTVFFRYVFGSDEYNEFVDSFNDVFAFFVNGTNCATLPGGAPVSINTVNKFDNPSLYRNNDPSDGPPGIDLQADGLTTVLTCEASVTPNETNTIKLAIADGGDSSYDSWVWLEGGSFSTTPPEGTDLSVTKTDTPDPVTGNGIVQYLVDVTNNGPVDSNVSLSEEMSDGEIVAIEGSGWTCEIGESSDTASCNLDESLAAGDSAPTVEVFVQAPPVEGPTTITNTATVSGDGEDLDPSNNVATEDTQVNVQEEDQAITYCPPSGCTFQTGSSPNQNDNTTNTVEVPPGGDGSVARISETLTSFPCGGNTGTGEEASGQETDFLPPTGITDPNDPIKVTTTWHASAWPEGKGKGKGKGKGADPGSSNGQQAEGQVKVCMQKEIDDGSGGTTTGPVFRVERCVTVGVADPAPCWDQVTRNPDGSVSVRFLMLSVDPQWRR